MSGAVGRESTRRALLVCELALALVLLAGAGLMTRTMSNLFAVDLGFEPEQVLSARVTLPTARYPPDARRHFMTRAEEHLRAIPGVAQAAFTISLPVQGSFWGSVFIVEDQPVPARADLPSAAWTPVTPNYFDTIRVPLLRGRPFDDKDAADAPATVIVNETFARRFWPDGDAIGKRVKQGWPEDKTPWREIVGIVRDVKTGTPDDPTAMQVYMPLAQMTQVVLTAVVRAHGDPMLLAQPVTAAIQRADPALPVFDVRTLEQVIGRAVAQQQLVTVLLVGFGAVALILAAIGVFGVTAYSVSQRRHELGVRMALGADRLGVVRLVLSQGLATCAAGIVIGLVLALMVGQGLEAMLYETSPYDATTLGAVAGALLIVGAIACLVPALRATQVDPATALRAD